MFKSTPSETIATITQILLTCERRASIRDFAGWSAGKRRDLRSCRFIAERIAPRYLYPLAFRDGERIVGAAELAAIVETVMLELPEQRAFQLVSKSADQVSEVRMEIAATVAARFVAAFTITENDHSAEHLRQSSCGDGTWWETGQGAP